MKLTNGNNKAYEESNTYKIPVFDKWIYCKNDMNIEVCSDFENLKLEKEDGNIYFYGFKGYSKIEKMRDTYLYLCN